MTKVKENLLWERADNCASKSRLFALRKQKHIDTKRKILKKYAKQIELPAGEKIVLLFAVAAHLGAAVVFAFNLKEIFYAASANLNESASIMPLVKALSSVFLILGMSLIIGSSILKIEFKWDEIVPRSVHFNKKYFFTTLLGLVFYFTFLLKVIELGISMTIEKHFDKVELIFYLCLLELFTSVWAIQGWQLFYVELKLKISNIKITYSERKAKTYRMRCDRSFFYYQQKLSENNSIENTYMTDNIQQVLNESESEGLS